MSPEAWDREGRWRGSLSRARREADRGNSRCKGNIAGGRTMSVGPDGRGEAAYEVTD